MIYIKLLLLRISLLVLVALVPLAGFTQSHGCSITIIDVTGTKKLSCTIQLVDDSQQIIVTREREDGQFDFITYKDIIAKDNCRIKIVFKNKDYFPAETRQLFCPIECNKRILAKKKPDF